VKREVWVEIEPQNVSSGSISPLFTAGASKLNITTYTLLANCFTACVCVPVRLFVWSSV